MRNAVIVAALALSLSACSGGGAQTQEFTRADIDAVKQTTTELTGAFNQKDVDKVVSLYAENSVFMPPNAPLLRGREPLKSFYSDMIAKGATNLELEAEEVGGHGPIAFETGTYSITYENGARRDRGKYMRILRNTAGTWRTEKTMWSSDLPPVKPSGD